MFAIKRLSSTLHPFYKWTFPKPVEIVTYQAQS